MIWIIQYGPIAKAFKRILHRGEAFLFEPALVVEKSTKLAD